MGYIFEDSDDDLDESFLKEKAPDASSVHRQMTTDSHGDNSQERHPESREAGLLSQLNARPNSQGEEDLVTIEAPTSTKAKAGKPESSARPKVTVVEPEKDDDSDEDESDDDEDDSDDDKDMMDASDDEDDSEDEDEETRKKAKVEAGPSKKRPTESATKTPVPAKKVKLDTPQKTNGKKGGGYTATHTLQKRRGNLQQLIATRGRSRPQSLRAKLLAKAATARPLLTRALEDGNYDSLVDARLQRNYNTNEMACMVVCATASVCHSARRRPRMSQIVRALEGDVSLSDLNEGIKPGHSTVYSSYTSSDYDTSQYNEDLKKFRKMALGSQEYGASSEYSNPTSDYGLYPSGSSSEGQQTTREMEMGKMKKDSSKK